MQYIYLNFFTNQKQNNCSLERFTCSTCIAVSSFKKSFVKQILNFWNFSNTQHIVAHKRSSLIQVSAIFAIILDALLTSTTSSFARLKLGDVTMIDFTSSTRTAVGQNVVTTNTSNIEHTTTVGYITDTTTSETSRIPR